jgi:3-oxoadipate enol-lactonase
MLKRVVLADISLRVFDAGVGLPLVFVHGFPLDHTMWRGQLEHFARSRRVIAPDLRGLGQSELDHLPAITTATYADDIAALLDKLGIDEKVDLCGLSLGGCITWQFAMRHRQRLRTLIQCDCRAAADTEETRGVRQRLAERVLAEGPAFIVDQMQPRLFCEETLRTQPAVVDATAKVIRASPPTGVAAASRALASRPDLTPLLPTMNVPALVICGTHDVISPLAEMRAIAAAMPRGEFAEIAGAGHMAPLEQPTSVNLAIADFLGRHG